MPKFEWDNNKNRSNQKKHGISFEDASDIFNDNDRIQYQETRDGEKRYKIIGKAFEAIITVIYTMRDLIVRIISARRSSKDERKTYLTNKLSKKAKDDE
ncbi:MAG: BrnT family toxin [Saprospiraceae bacterium]